MKFKLLLFLSFIVFINENANAQLTDALYFGDILFTKEASTITKKREMLGMDICSPEESLFGSVFLKVKMKSHTAFRNNGDNFTAALTIKAETGEQTTLNLRFNQEQGNDKNACFEIIPDVLDMENSNHLKLAGFLGKLPASTCSLLFTIGNKRSELLRPDGYVNGRIDIDISNGIGKFQALKDEQNRLDKIAEEERLVKEAEEKRLAEERAQLIKKTRDEYFSARDIVKIAFKNTCDHEGTIRIVTENEFTNQGTGVSGQRQTDFYKCRPGDKVYDSNGKLLHTVSASSNNKVISFCPPKTQDMLDKEEFDKGFKNIRIQIYNSCSDVKIYYKHESGASTTNSSLGSNVQTSLTMRKGDKLWLADGNGNKTSVIFEPTSYTQDGKDVYLCR